MVASTTKFDYIYCDPVKCVGCQLCEYVCSYNKTGEYNSYRSRIRTVRVDEVLITAIACRTCENALVWWSAHEMRSPRILRRALSTWTRPNVMAAPGVWKPAILAPSPLTPPAN